MGILALRYLTTAVFGLILLTMACTSDPSAPDDASTTTPSTLNAELAGIPVSSPIPTVVPTPVPKLTSLKLIPSAANGFSGDSLTMQLEAFDQFGSSTPVTATA